jgi:hypothetical protein
MNKVYLILTLIIFLESCASLNLQRIAPNYIDAYTNIKGSIFGFQDYPITRDLVDNIPYASLKLKIGKGSAGLLILEEKQAKNLTYVSADNVRIVLHNGKIIRTSGLDNNLVKIKEPKDSFKKFLISKEDEISYYTYSTYDYPALIDMQAKITLKKLGTEEVDILDTKYYLVKFQEIVENSYLGWKVINFYWIDSTDYFVWRSQQSISPLLPIINYEVTKKPTL